MNIYFEDHWQVGSKPWIGICEQWPDCVNTFTFNMACDWQLKYP